ncbi:hypothetical protein BY996DRAFT_6416320 [Phakopsora pachyrhizi]|nr:hypothetical protein BY996DRAFT_6416320 [Phakopsora pachyrhizi]
MVIDLSRLAVVNIVEPTEAALKVLAEKLQTSDRAFNSNVTQLSSEQRTCQALELNVKEYAQQALRVLALAVITDVQGDAAHYKTQSSADYIKFEHNMTLVGLVGMLDPPCPKVKGVIAKCRSSGIKVIVITGDNKATAEMICQQIMVFGPSNDLSDQSYTGREFDALSESEKRRLYFKPVFSRALSLLTNRRL